MGLTEAVFTICEESLHNWAKYSDYDIDEESNEYYSWLVDNSNAMAHGIFEAIDKSMDEYFDFGNPVEPPPEKK